MFRFIPVLAGTVIVSAMICFATPVLADAETAESQAAAEIQKAEEENPKICRRVKPTGSNISKTYCYRKKTWDAMREESQRYMRDINDRSSVNTGSDEGRH